MCLLISMEHLSNFVSYIEQVAMHRIQIQGRAENNCQVINAKAFILLPHFFGFAFFDDASYLDVKIEIFSWKLACDV